MKFTVFLKVEILPVICRGGLQFRRISAVAQKYFDALPCFFFNDIHATSSVDCKYISFLFECNIDQFYAKLYFLLNCTALFTIARLEVLLITQTKVFVKHTTLIDKCKNKRKIM